VRASQCSIGYSIAEFHLIGAMALSRLGIWTWLARAAIALLAFVGVSAPALAQKPVRIVSLNMCTDNLILRLAELDNIASVTWLSRDPRNSGVADLAKRVGVNHGLAEEIVPLDPDLILAGVFSTRTAVSLIKRTPLRLVEFGIPKSFAEVREQIASVADLVGERQNGEAMIRAMDERLSAVKPASGARPRAIVLNPNGATVGRGSLVSEIMELAGLRNVAAELDIESYGLVPLENVVLNDVDILIVSASRDGPSSLATEILNHPVLARLSSRVKIVSVPSRYWGCGGPEAAEAVAYLRNEVIDWQRGRAPQ
jgi:iron complex transport system substrate-binding protein